MRFVFLMPIGVERPSGRRYFNIARELARRGHQVRLLALHPDLASAPRRRLVCEGVEVWYVGQMHVRKTGSKVERFGPFTLLRVLSAAVLGFIWGVLRSPADIYHLGKPQPLNGLAALIAVVGLRRRPFYLDCDDDEVYSNRFTAPWQAAVFGFWQWLLPRLARGVTVNTLYLADRVRAGGAQRVVHVPNGVDLARLADPDPALLNGLRAALRLEGRRVIAYIGTLALHNHPVDLLLPAFAEVAAACPDAVLLLVGGGEDLPALRRWSKAHGLAGRVYFTGQVDHRLAIHLLALAQVSVDPVRDDSVARARSPLKLLESLALGVPVVTGDVGDRRLLLDDGRAGLLVEPGSAPALAAGIRRLLDDPSERAGLAAHARQHIQAYDWARLAARWETVYW